MRTTGRGVREEGVQGKVGPKQSRRLCCSWPHLACAVERQPTDGAGCRLSKLAGHMPCLLWLWWKVPEVQMARCPSAGCCVLRQLPRQRPPRRLLSNGARQGHASAGAGVKGNEDPAGPVVAAAVLAGARVAVAFLAALYEALQAFAVDQTIALKAFSACAFGSLCTALFAVWLRARDACVARGIWVEADEWALATHSGFPACGAAGDVAVTLNAVLDFGSDLARLALVAHAAPTVVAATAHPL